MKTTKMKKYKVIMHEKGKSKDKFGDEILATSKESVKRIITGKMVKKVYPNIVLDEIKEIKKGVYNG